MRMSRERSSPLQSQTADPTRYSFQWDSRDRSHTARCAYELHVSSTTHTQLSKESPARWCSKVRAPTVQSPWPLEAKVSSHWESPIRALVRGRSRVAFSSSPGRRMARPFTLRLVAGGNVHRGCRG